MALRAGCQQGHVSGVALLNGFDQHYRDLVPIDQSGTRRLAEVIKQTRGELDWTQKDLSEKSGVSIETIKRYENAKIRSPEAEPVRKIFKALGLDAREIPVILGLVTREEMGLPPEPVRILSRATQQIIDLLEDPAVSHEERLAIAELLRARRGTQSEPASAERRKAG